MTKPKKPAKKRRARRWKDLYVVADKKTGLLVVSTFCYSKAGARQRAREAFAHGPSRGVWKSIYAMGYRVVCVDLTEVPL